MADKASLHYNSLHRSALGNEIRKYFRWIGLERGIRQRFPKPEVGIFMTVEGEMFDVFKKPLVVLGNDLFVFPYDNLKAIYPFFSLLLISTILQLSTLRIVTG